MPGKETNIIQDVNRLRQAESAAQIGLLNNNKSGVQQGGLLQQGQQLLGHQGQQQQQHGLQQGGLLEQGQQQGGYQQGSLLQRGDSSDIIKVSN